MLQEYHEQLLEERANAVENGDEARLAEIDKSIEVLSEF